MVRLHGTRRYQLMQFIMSLKGSQCILGLVLALPQRRRARLRVGRDARDDEEGGAEGARREPLLAHPLVLVQLERRLDELLEREHRRAVVDAQHARAPLAIAQPWVRCSLWSTILT